MMSKIHKNFAGIGIFTISFLSASNAFGQTNPLFDSGHIYLRNCTNKNLTITMYPGGGSYGVEIPMPSHGEKELMQCGKSCNLEIETPDRNAFRIKALSEGRYIIDLATDEIGSFWRIRQMSGIKDPC